MTELWTDKRLDAVLASVGEHLVIPEDDAGSSAAPPTTDPAAARPDIPPMSPADGRPRRSRAEGPRRRLLRPSAVPRRAVGWPVWRGVAVAAVVVALALAATVAPVRRAVADWFGIGSTQVQRVPDVEGDPAGLPSIDDDLPEISSIEAAGILGHGLPPTGDMGLGPPDRLVRAPEGGVILAWDQGETTLWIRSPDDGSNIGLGKLLSQDVRVASVDELGDGALVIEGRHVLSTPDRRIAADNVVIWLAGEVEYRLESDVDADRLVQMARSLD